NVQIQREIHARLEEYLDLRGLDPARPVGEDLWEKTENAICDIVEQLEADGGLPAGVSQETLVRDVLNEALGLGPLEGLLQDETVSQVLVNRPDRIYVVRNGATEPLGKVFSSDRAALNVVARLLAPVGRKVDETTPVCDARLRDGALLNVVVPPVAVFGPTFTLRKLQRSTWTLDSLVSQGALSREMAELLRTAVSNRRSVVVSGPAGAGKTALLGALVAAIRPQERVVTVEEVAEISPPQENVVALESRPGHGADGRASLGVRDVLRNALRMQPDRLVVGELRGPETLDLLQAMQTGHEGVITSINAGSPREALHRLESLALTSGVDLPTRALRAIISEAVQLLVQLARYADGSVKVLQVTEVGELQGDVISLQDVFYFQQESFDQAGHVRGRFSSTGYAPRFYEDLRNRGVDVNMGIFHT
ncbi:MAG TPA: ATPase, T2SS/T4P/T4SS family, partial [Myxococcota bacterium]|nr:ATPase, T2SS/T4P/T4SS family [Myxococcota bacterium]